MKKVKVLTSLQQIQIGDEILAGRTFSIPDVTFLLRRASDVSGPNHPPTIPGLPDFHQNFHRIWQHTQDLDIRK